MIRPRSAPARWGTLSAVWPNRFGRILRVSIAWLIVCYYTGPTRFSNAQTAEEPAKAAAKPGEKQASPLDSPTFIIVDDPKRIGDLFERLDSPDFRLVRPDRNAADALPRPNPDSFVKTVSIRGQMNGSIANLTIRLEIQQTSPGTVWTPIGLDGIVLRSIRSGGKTVASSVLRPGGPWQVRTDSTGTHTIEVELGTEVVSDRSTRRLTLSIPEAASTELNMEVPEQVLFATTNARDSLQSRYVPERRAYEISGLLTARNRIELRWLGQSLIRGEDRVRLDCRGQIAIRMDFDAVSTRHFWQIRPLSGIPLTLSFEMPEDETLLDLFVDGQSVRPRFEKSGTGFVTVTVDNPASVKGPNSDSITLEMVTRAGYPSNSGKPASSSRAFPWRVPRWKNGEIVSGIVSLELPDKWVYVTEPGPAQDPVDPRDLPDRLRKSANQTAFRFSGGAFDVTLRSRRRLPTLFTDVRTIGIVRRSQVEYVSDIVIQGEIDPLREYEIELDRGARPLFVGPRDVWERYEIVGDSAAGERKLRRLRLTPNRSLKADTPATLRLRYLRRSDSPDSFLASLPRLVDATGESYRTWLLPEPSIAIEPASTDSAVRKRLPNQDAGAFSNLLEQSVGDEDKWIDPRAATELPGAFFRSANPFEREISFRTLVRPPSLDYTQHFFVTPAREAIRIRHVFECLVEQGNFEKVIIVPGRDNPIRNLRYTMTHQDATQSGNLIAEGGVFVIPLPVDFARQFTLTLEAVRAWSERQEKGNRDAAESAGTRDFDAAIFDFSISDGVRLQRNLTLEDSDDAVSRLVDRSAGWVETAPDDTAASGRSQAWTAVNTDSPWPLIRTLPLASKSDSASVPQVREIEARFDPGPEAALAAVYRVVPGVRELRLKRKLGWNVVSADFDGRSLDVAMADDAWTIVLPPRSTSGSLRMRFRADRRTDRPEIPLPADETEPHRIPTSLIVVHSPTQRFLPPWRSGWKLADAPAGIGLGEFEPVPPVDPSGLSFAMFRTDDPSRPLPLRSIPLAIPLAAAFFGAVAALAWLRKVAPGAAVPVLAIALVAAFVASGQLGGIWALSLIAGVLAGSVLGRFYFTKAATARFAGGFQSAGESFVSPAGSALSGSKLQEEPSTVLKRGTPEVPSKSTDHPSVESSGVAPESDSDEARWSLALDASANATGNGSTVTGRAADPSR